MTMGGTAGAPPGSSAKTPLGSSAAYYSTDRASDRAADRGDMNLRSSREAAFQPLGPDEGRRNLYSHNDELIRSLKLDALDESIPMQMKSSQEHEDRRAARIARRDTLQMEKDLRAAPLDESELTREMTNRMRGPTASAAGAPGRRGSILTRRFNVGGVRSVAAIAAIDAGVNLANSYFDNQDQLALAGKDQEAAAQATIQGTRNLAGGIPILGGIALGIANLAGRATGYGSLGGAEATLQEAAQQNAHTSLVNQNLRYVKDQADQIASLRNPRDTFGNQRITISSNLRRAVDEANDWGVAAHSADRQDTNRQAINDQVKKRIENAKRIAALEKHEVDRTEQLTTQSLRTESDILDLRKQGKGHLADRAELEKKLNEDIRAHQGTNLQGVYTTLRDQQLALFDRNLANEQSRMRAVSASDVRAAGLSAAGQDIGAALSHLQGERFDTLSRMQQLFGTGSTEFTTANANFNAQEAALRTQLARRSASFFDASRSSARIAGFNATGDVLGASLAQLEHERRERIRTEVPGLIDPLRPAESRSAAERAINAEIDARRAAAIRLRNRDIGMSVEGFETRATANRLRTGTDNNVGNFALGDLAEQFGNFRTTYNNVQGSTSEQLRIRRAMLLEETSALKLQEQNVVNSLHTEDVHQGQFLHSNVGGQQSDMAQTLKAIHMILQMMAQKLASGGAIGPFSFGNR
jgi:hypothetical protein